MQSNVDSVCKAARERIAIPPIPLAAIRNAAAQREEPKPRKPWAGSIAAMLAGSALLAAAAGAAVWSSTHVSVNPSGMFEVHARKASSRKNPTTAELRALTQRADFPVVLPTGLPAGTTLEAVSMFDSSALMLTYGLPGAWRRSDHLLPVVLANPHSVGGGSPKNTNRSLQLLIGRKGSGAQQWTIGGEKVMVMSSTMTPAELARMKHAMLATSRRR